MSADGLPNIKPLGIYVHWPFCAAKCPYCDFNSHVRHGGVDEPSFARALARELDYFTDTTGGRPVTSVFFGGGTPSLMSPETIAIVLDCVADRFRLSPDAEITLEANPTSVEADRFAGYRTAGINRVSLGVQAMNDADLKTLGRLHTAKEALAAVDLARSTFERVSFDMIYARPGQTLETWKSELREALARGPDHLSLYQLTIEPGTPFHGLQKSGRLIVPDDETAARLFDLTQDLCEAAGLPAYEVSNHARSGQESRHNLTYWRSGDFIGIGPGAYGRFDDGSGRIETSTIRHPETWRSAVEAHGHGLDRWRKVSREEAGDEVVMMGLRLSEGFSRSDYETRSQQPLSPDAITHLEGLGMIRTDGDRIIATSKGRKVLNRVIAELCSD